MSGIEDLLTPGESCWWIETASRASVIVDADDYFRVAREAMLAAKRQILLIGWDFDARIRLSNDESKDDDGPNTVGAFISWLVDRTPGLEVYLLRWDMGALKVLTRGSTVFTVLNWMRKRRIHTKLDGHHPTGASHHQKIVVIDDCLAFCGGIDMTAERWDTRDHADDEPRRVDPAGRAYKPWHDATTALEGPAAKALGELARERWAIAGGRPITPPRVTTDCWPPSLTATFTGISVAISRTAPEMPDQPPVHEIEALYLALIARAKRRIYAESQYFASRRVAEAMARRLDEPDGPEIVIVNPDTAQGWLEPLAMDTARARLVEALRRRDRHGRFRMYHPVTAGGQSIYVHAKILIIDDDVIRIGSSNFNNRSLRLDTECDVTMREDGDAIPHIRSSLIAEHLGLPVDTVAERLATGSMIDTIESLRGRGKTLVPYEVPDLSTVEAWLADNEVLDPEGADEMFETMSTRPGLLRHLKHSWSERRERRTHRG